MQGQATPWNWAPRGQGNQTCCLQPSSWTVSLSESQLSFSLARPPSFLLNSDPSICLGGCWRGPLSLCKVTLSYGLRCQCPEYPHPMRTVIPHDFRSHNRVEGSGDPPDRTLLPLKPACTFHCPLLQEQGQRPSHHRCLFLGVGALTSESAPDFSQNHQLSHHRLLHK